ncbi:MAG TPA: IS66 family insertion sequence element accessory protein TnpB [Saprospiraceae bacterium]|jgi:transposase|nr:IS66 family insertion sequence element accessory protein TnpB [Saprospiraceae bacterium]
MLSFSSKQRYFLYGPATDMRKGFAGLSGLVRQHINHELLSGDVFIFINRRRDRIKLLMWDATGFALYYKQLERGTFELPDTNENGSLELSWSDLVMLLEGVEIKSIKRRKRYEKRA